MSRRSANTEQPCLNLLPTELVTTILSNLAAKDLSVFSRTNKKFQEIADSDYLWKPWCRQWDVSALDSLLLASNSNWKKFATEFANRVVKLPPVIAVSECQFVQNQTTQLCSKVVFNFFERNGLQYFIQVCSSPFRIVVQPESKGKVNLDSTKQRSTVSIQVKIKQEEDKYIFQAIVCDYFNEKVQGTHIMEIKDEKKDKNIEEEFKACWENLLWQSYFKYLDVKHIDEAPVTALIPRLYAVRKNSSSSISMAKAANKLNEEDEQKELGPRDDLQQQSIKKKSKGRFLSLFSFKKGSKSSKADK